MREQKYHFEGSGWMGGGRAGCQKWFCSCAYLQIYGKTVGKENVRVDEGLHYVSRRVESVGWLDVVGSDISSHPFFRVLWKGAFRESDLNIL